MGNILFDFQVGFKKLQSNKLALIEFTDNIWYALDEGCYAIIVFVNLTIIHRWNTVSSIERHLYNSKVVTT